MCCGGVVYFCSYMGERARATVELMLWLVMIMACCQPHLQAASSRLMEWPLRQGASSFVQRNLWAPNIQTNCARSAVNNKLYTHLYRWVVGGWVGGSTAAAVSINEINDGNSCRPPQQHHLRIDDWVVGGGINRRGGQRDCYPPSGAPSTPDYRRPFPSLNSPSLFLSSYKKTNKTNDKSKGIMHKYV
jgi:hypothetical protein